MIHENDFLNMVFFVLHCLSFDWVPVTTGTDTRVSGVVTHSCHFFHDPLAHVSHSGGRWNAASHHCWCCRWPRGTHSDSATAAVSRGGWRRRRDSHARGWSSSHRRPWSPLERALHQQKATWRVCPLRGVTGRFTFAVITDPLGLKADV